MNDNHPIHFELKKSVISTRVFMIVFLVGISIVCLWGLTEKPEKADPIIVYALFASVAVFLFVLSASSLRDLLRGPTKLDFFQDHMIWTALTGPSLRVDYADITSIDKTLSATYCLKTEHGELELSNDYSNYEKLSEIFENLIRPIFRQTCVEKLEKGRSFVCGMSSVTKTGFAVFLIVCLLGVALGIYTYFFPPFQESFQQNDNAALLLIFFSGLGLAVVILLFFGKSYRKYVLDKDQIEVRTLFSSQKYLWGSIAGIEFGHSFDDREKKNITAVVLTASDQRKILAGATQTKNFEAFRTIAENRVRVSELPIPATDDKPATDDDEHKKRYDLAAKWFGIFKWAAVGVFIWALARPQPYDVCILTLVLLPVINALFAFYFSDVLKGRADIVKAGMWWNVSTGFLIPFIMLAMRAYLDWNILDAGKLWLPVGTATVVLSGLSVLSIRDFREKPIGGLMLIPFAFLYAYGLVISANCMLDKTDPEIHRLILEKKEVSNGDSSTSYYFQVGPGSLWDHQKEIRVRKSVYKKYEKGEAVTVEVRKGKLDIPWYQAT